MKLREWEREESGMMIIMGNRENCSDNDVCVISVIITDTNTPALSLSNFSKKYGYGEEEMKKRERKRSK